MIAEMTFYSVRVIQDVALWLVDCPVVLTFVGLGVLAFVAGLVKRMVSA